MKTYNVFYALLLLFLIGCSSNDDGQNDGNNNNNGVDADYSILTTNSGILSGTLLNASLETITLNPQASPFGNTSEPLLTSREGMEFSYYSKNSDCSGTLRSFNFGDSVTQETSVFEDLTDCTLVATALAHAENSFYIAYKIPPGGGKPIGYFIRTIDMDAPAPNFIDVELDREPIQIRLSNNHLFILTKDAADGDKNALLVLDASTNELIHEVNLDFNVKKIHNTTENNVLVSYDDLHLVIDSATMAIVSTVRYEVGKEPNFADSETNYFDATGRLYFQRPSGTNSEHPTIPAVFDFSTNTSFLYIYELFLSDSQRQFEFEIGDTSMVSYDAKNDLILIGYQKSSNPNLGGLLRLKPVPNPEFIDNIDLDGVPYDIFVE